MSWDAGAFAPRWLGLLLVASVIGLCACTTTSKTTDSGVPRADSGPTASPEDQDPARRADVRMQLATAYFGRGQLSTALDEVKRALEADPTRAAAYDLRGLIYAGLGDDKRAEESFRQALKLAPSDADTMQNFGWYLCQNRRFGEADEMFRQALAVPQYRFAPRTLMTQGICQARDGQWEHAEHTLSRSYELDPSNPVTAVNLSEVLYHRGEYERARFYIGRVNNNPDVSNAQTLWLAARIAHRMGDGQAQRDLGAQLRSRFPQSRETLDYEQGKFDG